MTPAGLEGAVCPSFTAPVSHFYTLLMTPQRPPPQPKQIIHRENRNWGMETPFPSCQIWHTYPNIGFSSLSLPPGQGIPSGGLALSAKFSGHHLCPLSAKGFYLSEFKLLLVSPVLKTEGKNKNKSPWLHPGYLQRCASSAAVQPGAQKPLHLGFNALNLNDFRFGFVFCKWRWIERTLGSCGLSSHWSWLLWPLGRGSRLPAPRTPEDWPVPPSLTGMGEGWVPQHPGWGKSPDRQCCFPPW